MKSLAALGAAFFIAAAGALWYVAKPTIIAVKAEPLRPNADLPTFKRLER